MVVIGLAGIIQSTGVWKLWDSTPSLGKVSPPYTSLPVRIQVVAYFYSSFQTNTHMCLKHTYTHVCLKHTSTFI